MTPVKGQTPEDGDSKADQVRADYAKQLEKEKKAAAKSKKK